MLLIVNLKIYLGHGSKDLDEQICVLQIFFGSITIEGSYQGTAQGSTDPDA